MLTIVGVHVCLEIGLGMGLGGLWLVIAARAQFYLYEDLAIWNFG